MSGASAAATAARSKAVSRVTGSTVAASAAGAAAIAGSERLRWELTPATREALSGAIATPVDAASAPRVAAPRVATRFQSSVAVFSISVETKPPSLAAPQPAKVTVPHNSTSANCRRLPIARLPPFGYRKVRRTAPAHDRIGLSPHHGSCKTRALRVMLFRKCVAKIQPRAVLAIWHRPGPRAPSGAPLDIGRLIRMRLGDRMGRLVGRGRT